MTEEEKIYKRTVGAWTIAVILVSFLIGMALWIFPTIEPNYPNQLAKALLLRGTLGLATCFMIICFLAFLNNITGPSWWDKISEDWRAIIAVIAILCTAFVASTYFGGG